jgi:hypothetical protein
MKAKKNKWIILIGITCLFIFLLLFLSILNVQYKKAATETELKDIFISTNRGYENYNAQETSRHEKINEIFVLYQQALQDLVDVYIVHEDAYIDIFLSISRDKSIASWNGKLQETEKELKKAKFKLAYAQTELERTYFSLSQEEKLDNEVLFILEFADFIDVQINESDYLLDLAERKINKEIGVGEDGYLGAHHVFERKKKQIAEQSALLFEKHHEKVSFSGVIDDSHNATSKYSLNATISMRIIKDYIYEKVGWP